MSELKLQAFSQSLHKTQESPGQLWRQQVTAVIPRTINFIFMQSSSQEVTKLLFETQFLFSDLEHMLYKTKKKKHRSSYSFNKRVMCLTG